MTKILPVDGAKRDIWSTAGDDEHDKLYRKLLIQVLYDQEENYSSNSEESQCKACFSCFKSCCPNCGSKDDKTPFQHLINNVKTCQPGASLPNHLKRIYYLVMKNPEKITEKNVNGDNAFHISIQHRDNYTALLLSRLLHSLSGINLKDIDSNSTGRLLQYSSEK